MKTVNVVLIYIVILMSIGITSFGQDIAQPVHTTIVSWHPDGQYLAILQESQVDIIDASTIEVLNTITGLDAPLTRSVWSPDGQLFAFANSNHVAIWSTPWNLQQSHLVRELKIYDEDTSAGDVSWVDGWIAMSSDTDVIIFETENYSNILQIPQLNPIRDLQLSEGCA